MLPILLLEKSRVRKLHFNTRFDVILAGYFWAVLVFDTLEEGCIELTRGVRHSFGCLKIASKDPSCILNVRIQKKVFPTLNRVVVADVELSNLNHHKHYIYSPPAQNWDFLVLFTVIVDIITTDGSIRSLSLLKSTIVCATPTLSAQNDRTVDLAHDRVLCQAHSGLSIKELDPFITVSIGW